MTRGGDAPTDEAELLSRVTEGCEASFRVLYQRHTTVLYRLALRLAGGNAADAEDVVQETWRRAVRGAPSFQHRSPLRSWLVGIAVRVSLEGARGRRRQDRDAASSPLSAAPAAPGAGRRAGHRAASQIDLERAVAQLSPGYRAVLVLHDVEGFKHEEIGKLLGISPGTSKSQLSRARQRVRNALGDDYASA